MIGHLRRGIAEGGSRPMRASRPVRIALRTLHVGTIAALYGGHVFGVERERLLPALLATLASGLVFMLFEIWRSPIWLVQLRGMATYTKLVLLLSVEIFWEQRILLLSLVLVIGVAVSHMPGRFRYYSLLHRREMHGGEKG